MDTIRVSHNLDQYNFVSQPDSRVAKNGKLKLKFLYHELVISKHPLMIGIANVLCSDMQASDQKTSSQQLNVSDLIMSL